MFSRPLHPFIPLLFQATSSPGSPTASHVDRQLQLEFSQAVERGMVSTRSQDHTPAGVGTRLMKEVGSSNVTSGKSKQEDGVGPSPAQAVTKGRRISSTSKSELVSVVIPATPTGNALAEKTMASVEELPELRSKDQEPSVKDECSRSPTTPAQNTARGRPKSSISKRKKLSQNNTDSTSGNTTTESVNGVTRAFPDAGVADHEEPKKRSRPKTSKKSTLVPYPSADAGEGSNLANNNPPTFNLKVVGRQDKKQEEDIVDHGNGKPIVVKESKEVSPSPADRRKVIANVAKPKHKRFGSEDAVETAPQFATGGAESEHRSSAAENEESEDDAPETVTVSAGFDEARTSAIKAAKLAAKQNATQKLKRKEHSLRLEAQAKSAKSDSKTDNQSNMGTGNARDAVSTVNIDNDQLSAMKHKPMGKGPLPLILPDEILAVEPAARAPTPPPSTAKIVTNHKRRFLDVETKPPKDIIRGDVRIRVLQENSIILPPKASAASKSVREAWLAGRRVLKGQIAVPRRKLGGGFVRR